MLPLRLLIQLPQHWRLLVICAAHGMHLRALGTNVQRKACTCVPIGTATHQQRYLGMALACDWSHFEAHHECVRLLVHIFAELPLCRFHRQPTDGPI